MGYTDAPDGEECFDKIWTVSKTAGLVGLVVSIHDTYFVTRPQGYVPTIAVFLKCTLPLVGAGATFAAVTCASCNFRQKDDKINYLIGGGSAGGIIGIAARSVKVGAPLSFVLAIAAALYKDSNDNGWDIVPKVHRKFGGFNHMQEDWTSK